MLYERRWLLLMVCRTLSKLREFPLLWVLPVACFNCGSLNQLPGHFEKSKRLRAFADHFLGLYNAFLAPGSPCELNIDHTLRQDMASRMTRAVAKDDAAMYGSLKDVQILFDRAQQQVFKLMAGVSFHLSVGSKPLSN